MIGNIITDPAVQEQVGYDCYDIVIANILAEVLVDTIMEKKDKITMPPTTASANIKYMERDESKK